jgi:DNA-binding transcriptional MerR regulator
MTITLTIGQLALQADVAATTLRYYERIGLIQSPARVGGQRHYDESIVARLEVIRLCKAAGFALDEIQLLFADDAPRPAGEPGAGGDQAGRDRRADRRTATRQGDHRVGHALHVPVDRRLYVRHSRR